MPGDIAHYQIDKKFYNSVKHTPCVDCENDYKYKNHDMNSNTKTTITNSTARQI